MNGQDKKDLNVILERMVQADKDRGQMHTDIKFIKENLFNPHEGLWAETKLNSQHRVDTNNPGKEGKLDVCAQKCGEKFDTFKEMFGG